MQVHVYSAQRKTGPIGVLSAIVREFPAAHALGFRLASRNIRSRYRQSLLGVLWAFLPPLATAVIWIFLNQIKVVQFASYGVPYPVFVITGTMLWSIFTASVLTPMSTMQTNRAILVKINFPREALLVSAFYEILFSAMISVIIIFIELLIFRIDLSLSCLLFFPGIFLLMLIGVSFGLLLVPVSLLYKDVQYVLPTLLQFCMYLTPVLYAKPIFTGIANILKYNPMAAVLVSSRSWLLGLPEASSALTLGLIAGACFVLLLLGILLQRLTIGIVIERMGN